tara:strand:+ start:3419 stop:4801 length:1383 start_codon:yes stop_codon:yes gene_type:complete
MADDYQISSSIEITASIDLSKILEILNVPYSDLISSTYNTLTEETGSEQSQSLQSQLSESLSPIPKSIEFIPIKGIIVDSETSAPLKGVVVMNILKIPKRTNEKGEFEIKVPSLLDTPFDPKKFPLSIIKRKYSPLKITPYTSTLDTKKDLGVIQLYPKELSLLEDIRSLLKFSDKETKEYVEKYVTIEFHMEKELNLSIENLKKLVIPLLLGLLSQYGISKVKELIEENKDGITDELKQLITCPLQEDIVKIIETQNKLIKQINNVFKVINRTTEILTLTQKILTPATILLPILEALPLPTAIAGVGIPVSVINGIQKSIRFLGVLIPKLSFANSILLSILTLLRSVLIQVLDILRFLDLVTQYCSSLDGVTQEQISLELTSFTQEQSQQLSPIVTNINGFEMGVETERTTNTLKRRRATATNTGGVVMLKGEWSFSSIDQILIDELVFYIQTNDLKAD